MIYYEGINVVRIIYIIGAFGLFMMIKAAASKALTIVKGIDLD